MQNVPGAVESSVTPKPDLLPLLQVDEPHGTFVFTGHRIHFRQV